MTPQNKEENLKKIREACIKVNPEIMELEMGCKVIVGADHYGCVIALRTLMDKNNEFTLTDRNGFKFLNVDVIEILGRPIRLADVLLAIEKSAKWFPDLWLESVFPLAAPFYENSWNLKDNNLEHQSEEALSFIAGLL